MHFFNMEFNLLDRAFLILTRYPGEVDMLVEPFLQVFVQVVVAPVGS